MQTNMEVAHQEHARDEDDTVDAEFVETSGIRRRPAGASSPDEISGPRITMALDRWLDVDRKLWELYNLVEIAIQQRDEAREDAREVDLERHLLSARLREWKTYARSLEKRLHAAQIENLELTHVAKRSADVAAEAVALSAFQRKRRQELRDRLDEISAECDPRRK